MIMRKLFKKNVHLIYYCCLGKILVKCDHKFGIKPIVPRILLTASLCLFMSIPPAIGADKNKAMPSLSIFAPKAKHAPKIDGIMSDGEWDNATSWPAGGWRFVDVRQVEFYIMWDSENVYVAQRAALLPGERLIRTGREPRPDIVSSFESEVELFFDAGTCGSNKMPCNYHIMGNACGNKWDVEEQYHIGIHNQDWNGDWSYAQQMTPDGKLWVTEFAIPRKNVFMENPLSEGIVWKMGFGRDGGRAPTGFFGCSAPVTFKKNSPVVHLSGVEKSVDNKMAFELSITNPANTVFKGALDVRMDKGDKPSEEQELSIEPGKTVKISIDKPAGLKKGETSNLSIVIRQSETIVFCWSKPVLYDDFKTKTAFMTPSEIKPFVASVTFNPVHNFLRARIDRYEYPAKSNVATCRFDVRAKGDDSVVASGKADKFSYDVADVKIGLPATLPVGEYEVTATIEDQNGRSLESCKIVFAKKDTAKEFQGLNNKIGVSDRILWPFQPMATSGNVIKPWAREIRLGDMALPSSIVTVGHSLLAEPVRIIGEAGGKPFIVSSDKEPKCVKSSTTVSEFSGSGQGGGIKVDSFLHMDYDGCAKIELKLSPAAGEKAEFEKLALEIPFYADQAVNMHTFRSDMRTSCYAGATPSGEGRVWDSTKVPVNKMAVGSFVPLVFLGTPAGGLTWFANSDEGWWPTDKYPGLEIIRKPGQVVLRLNLAAEKVTLNGTRTVVFGLHVSPVRPLNAKTWTPGSGICEGFSEVTGRFDRKIQKRTAYMYPAHPDKFNRYYTDRFNNQPMGIYTEDYATDVPAEYEEYFADVWTGGREKSLSDCALYYAKKVLEDCPVVHGFYIDNIYPHLTYNAEAGSAYVLPDGRIQPGFDIWEHRDYVRRLRTLLQDLRIEPLGIEVHMTCTMVIPIYAWADCMREGENPVDADNGRKDFADIYPPAFSSIMNNPIAWGVKSVHHWMFHIRENFFKSIGPDAMWKAQRTGIGHLGLYDNLFPRPEGKKEYLALVSQYNSSYGDVLGEERFMPYWEPQGYFRNMTPDTLVSVRAKSGRALVWIMNYSRQEQEVSVWLDLPRLLTDTATSRRKVSALDIETAELVSLASPFAGTEDAGKPNAEKSNVLKVKVPARDFRMILVN